MKAKIDFWMALELTMYKNIGTPIEYDPIEEDMDLDFDVEDEEE